MNGFEYNYDQVIIETAWEREEKKRRQKKLFSRVFLALFLYMLLTQVLSIVIYAVANATMSAEDYLKFAESTVWTIVLSSVTQYLIAFPILYLMLRNLPRSRKRVKSKISVKEFIVLFAIGQALMYAGNLIGVFLNNIVGTFTGNLPENGIESIVNDTPTALLFLVVVVIGPIVEELICRKLMIDRLSIYGDHIAIIFSSVAFGLLHGNLYQFFYATLLGALLGYVYTKTRDVRYSMLMHMIINFMGSIVTLQVQNSVTAFYEKLDALMSGSSVKIFSFLADGIITYSYMKFQYGLLIAGVIALVFYIKNKKISINTDKEIYLPDNKVVKNGVLNVGAILYIIITLVFIGLSLFLT